MVDYEDLTSEQQAAADARDRNVTLTAGAGTGKTTTLTARYLRLIERSLAEDMETLSPEEIITTTFTERAANDLTESVRKDVFDRLSETDADSYTQWRTVADDLDDGYIHTLHGFCSRLLREHAISVEPVDPGFETLDQADTDALIDDTVAEVIEAEETSQAVRTLARRFDRGSLRAVLADLLGERPHSTSWAERMLEFSATDYREYVRTHLHPVGPDEAAALLSDDEFVDAVDRLADHVADPAATTGEGTPWGRAVAVVERLEDTTYDDGVPTRDKQSIVQDIVAVLTKSDGESYADYTAAKTHWSDDAARASFDDAMTNLVTAIDPAEHLVDGSLDADENGFPIVQALAELTLTAATEYEQRKRRQNVVDFTDQVTYAIEFLAADRNADVRAALRDQFEYVMVDEFQDTDPRQWELIKLLSADDPDDFDARNVFVVGDVKQSIYRFRNADVTQFRETESVLNAVNERLSAAESKETSGNVNLEGTTGDADRAYEDPDTESATDAGTGADSDTLLDADAAADGSTSSGVDTVDDQLSTNFRTLPTVLEFVNDLFESIFDPDGEPYEAAPQSLTAHRNDPENLASVEYLLTPTDSSLRESRFDHYPEFAEAEAGSDTELEAKALAARLTQLLDTPAQVYEVAQDTDENDAGESVPESVEPEDIAILIRSRSRLKDYERELEAVGIPYTVASGTGFYESPEITALVNLLRTLADPGNERALYATLRSPLFGFTDDTLAKLKAHDDPLWTALGATSIGALSMAHDQLRRWRSMAGIETGTGTDAGLAHDADTESERALNDRWATFLTQIIEETGFLASVSADERPEQARANVEKFRDKLREMSDTGIRSLTRLVRRIERRIELADREGEAEISGETAGVRILTIHDAKGMEFPIVVVPGLHRGFNDEASLGNGRVEFERIGDHHEIGMKAPDPEDPFELVGTVARETVRERRRAEEQAEEKRVLYVACTRARDHLLLSGCHEVNGDEVPTMVDIEDGDAEDPGSLLDIVQPEILSTDILERLTTQERVRPAALESVPTLPNDGQYTVSLPTQPADWQDSGSPVSPDVQTSPEPTQPPWQYALSPTDLEPLFEGSAEIRRDEDARFISVRTPETGEPDPDEMPDRTAETGSSSTGDDSDTAADEKLVDQGLFGDIVHRLCELRAPEDRWPDIMAQAVRERGEDVELTPDIREQVEDHARPAIAYIDDRRADETVDAVYDELYVTAEFEHGTLSGLIDHLYVTPKTLHIVDYKTGRVMTDDLATAAADYQTQMQAYAAALHQQYPDRPITATLYFTGVQKPHSFEWSPSELDDIATELESRINHHFGL